MLDARTRLGMTEVDGVRRSSRSRGWKHEDAEREELEALEDLARRGETRLIEKDWLGLLETVRFEDAAQKTKRQSHSVSNQRKQT
jgi:hypothetical protein